jgi:hypothetical protein
LHRSDRTSKIVEFLLNNVKKKKVNVTFIKSMCVSGIKVHVHVTPYQVNDERRPWIRQEEMAFVETLRSLGSPVESSLHFRDDPPSLHYHFKLLNVFKQT